MEALLQRAGKVLMSENAEKEGWQAPTFDAFKKTVKLIEPDSARSEDELRALYDAIDADASGEISLKEFVQYALDSLSPLHADELRPAASSKAVTEQRGRWRFDPEDLSFLVKAFEPEYYCESRPALVVLTTMTSAALQGLSWSTTSRNSSLPASWFSSSPAARRSFTRRW